MIDFYRYFISPLFPQTCRFYPTCSQYAKDSILEFGVFKGLFYSVKRLIKCHPYHQGGYDPVPHHKTRDLCNGK